MPIRPRVVHASKEREMQDNNFSYATFIEERKFKIGMTVESFCIF